MADAQRAIGAFTAVEQVVSQQTRQLPDQMNGLDGLAKTAILLLHLDKEVAGKLLERIGAGRMEAVQRTLATIGEIPAHVVAAVLQEFYEAGRQQRGHRAEVRPQKSEARAAEDSTNDAPFSFLHKAEAAHLLSVIQEEHPQTIALILSHLPPRRAATILTGLSAPVQVEVVRRIAHIDRPRPDALREVEEALSPSVSGMFSQPSDARGGAVAVAEVLNLCDRKTERAVLDCIAADDPDLADDIRRLMFAFEDILGVSDRGIQALLKEIDHDELALALKTASEGLKAKIFANMSARACELIREEMEYMGPVRVNEVEAAQQRIVDVARRLEESGELITAGRGAIDEMVA